MNELSNSAAQLIDSLPSGELAEISLPKARNAESAVERQLDQLVDILAAERTTQTTRVVADWSTADPTINGTQDDPIELSIVMPCLDEADTVGTCVLKAIYSLERMGIPGEVIVADNGSTDDSVEIAESLGARVVHVDEAGYGAALMGGIEAARGKYVLMGDADDSYDFSQSHKFYEQLKNGAELVQGCRLPGGGGRIMKGAMPWLHQWGNPALTWLVQKMFRAPINDVYCGMRGFSKELYNRLEQRCTGMEFATEMIIKSTLFGAKINEVPITLHPDGRKAHRPHLRTFRDGWRTLRFFMMLSPRWTFLVPGATLATFGILGCLLVFMRVSLAGIVFDAHTLLVSTLGILVASQLGCFAVLAKTFAASEGILPGDSRIRRFANVMSLERTLWLSGALATAGVGTIAYQTFQWAGGGFGSLNYSETMRTMIPAVGAVALGMQWGFAGFLLKLFGLQRRK